MVNSAPPQMAEPCGKPQESVLGLFYLGLQKTLNGNLAFHEYVSRHGVC